MPTNRWVGQAAPVKEIKYYIPRTVTPGSRFQLNEGILRYGYTYPTIQPEADLTNYDRANRVVNELLDLVTADAGLGGGAADSLEYSASSYNGSPAIKIVGKADGQPVSVVASVTNPTINTINVQQMQEGSAGSNYVYSLAWPVAPSSGTWCIAANGKTPLVLAYNVSAANLRTALLTFGIACTDITVTGSYTAGYGITLVTPTGVIADPPFMFPIVPGPGTKGSVSFTLYEDRSYIFGPTTGYAGAGNIIEADATNAQMLTYLGEAARLGSLASAVTVTSVEIPASSGYIAGATYTLTFDTAAAYYAWVSMSKKVIAYFYGSTTSAPASGGYVVYSGTGVSYPNWTKFRQRPVPATSGADSLNPFNRKFCTKAGKDGTTPMTAWGTFIRNVAIATYKTSLVTARPHTVSGYSLGVSAPTFTTESSWTSESPTPVSWVLAAAGIVLEQGVDNGSRGDLTYTVIGAGEGVELGVNNNAGYTVETVGKTGIVSQEILIPQLDAKVDSLYHFEGSGRSSYKFTGASSLQMIEDAAGNLWGPTNISVAASADPAYSARIIFQGALSEVVVDATLVKDGDGGLGATVIDIEASTPMKSWVLKYQFTGGVCAGSWKFSGTAQTYPWITSEPYTAQDILDGILLAIPEYANVLVVGDIAIETEDVGRQFILRGFTITFQAQPSALFVGSVSIPFWLGLDTSLLLTSEPTVKCTAYGRQEKQEVQVVSIENKPTSGNWKLSYNGVQTANIAYNASAATVQTAVSALAGGACTVIGGAGGPYRIKWTATGSKFLMLGVNVSLTGSASAAIDTVTSVNGTGPNYYSNADNWTLGVPVDGQTLVYSDGDVDCCYGMTSSILPLQIDVYRSFTGNIGLPETRDDGAYETRPSWLTFTGTSGTALIIRVGLGESGDGPSVMRFAVDNRAFDAVALYVQSGLTIKPLAFKGANTANRLVCVQGDVAAGVRPDDVCRLASLQITANENSGNDMAFYSTEASIIDKLDMLGGDAVLGRPPVALSMVGGTAIVNGEGDCNTIDVINASLRWIASGKIGVSGVPTAITFGAGFTSSASTPSSVRFTSVAHGLASGDRIYIRAYSGVLGLNRMVCPVTRIDANTFDLVGVLAQGTLTGYANMVKWAKEKAITVRDGATIDFDSDGRLRDIPAPIVVQGTGAINDAKVTIVDLRWWAEASASSLGQGVEMRRVKRDGYPIASLPAGVGYWVIGDRFVVG